MYSKLCKICQHFKKRKNIYEHLPDKNIPELRPWYLVHVDLISPYRKSIIQKKPVGNIINNNISLTCMKMVDPATVWFKIIEIPTYDLDEVTGSND